ncbi:hypothetical protein [Methylomusa anaerophila]|uniref:Uncharacterized protein n=1 Tax=Methylomusa anaerophila TaxID=1930071 RepID=A0A348AEC2_9FIRM|nr:hypothetical protein [Methylomusa anaerophila]BBB89420.1 hypothetical protein MAMMFC1_00053 [Methylomusa anaerophila]
MTKRNTILLLLAILLIVACYQHFAGDKEVSGRIDFTRQGADVALDIPREVEKVTVKTGDGRILTTVTLGPGLRQKFPIFMKWESGQQYIFELGLPGSRSAVFNAQAPAAGPEKVSLLLQAPYGMSNEGSIGVVPAGSAFTANILITNSTGLPVEANLDLTIPAGVEVVSQPQGMKLEQHEGVWHLTGLKRITAKNEHWNEQIQLKAPQAGGKPVIAAQVNLDNGREQWQLTAKSAVQVATIADISSKIRVGEVLIPVDFTGRFDPKANSGSLIYAPPNRLEKIMGGTPDGRRLDDEPFAFAGIQVHNDGDEHVLALITGKITDPSDGKLAAAFTSPPHKNAGLGYSYGVADIAPHSVSQVILPIYINENIAVAGNYLFRTEASVFGVNQVICRTETNLQLVTRNEKAVIITMIMFLVALLGVAWLLLKQEAALARFTTKELVIVSLFGTVTFVTVNLPQTVVWDITHVIFGPFSFLVTGFISQTMLYALLVALVVLLPRPGAISLMIIVRFILNGFIFGHFSPVLLLNYAVLAVCLEGALFATGITRNTGGDPVAAGKALVAGLVCGLVDTVSSYMNFMAYMTLYRLFYADWYIYAVLVAGFVYTACGAAAGCRLGASLKRTAMD